MITVRYHGQQQVTTCAPCSWEWRVSKSAG